MYTEKKIKKVRQFLSSPDNKLIWNKSGKREISAGIYFDVEASQDFKEKEGIKCIEVDSFNEAFFIMKSITINIEDKSLRLRLESKVKKACRDLNKSFYLMFKGNF